MPLCGCCADAEENGDVDILNEPIHDEPLFHCLPALRQASRARCITYPGTLRLVPLLPFWCGLAGLLTLCAGHAAGARLEKASGRLFTPLRGDLRRMQTCWGLCCRGPAGYQFSRSDRFKTLLEDWRTADFSSFGEHLVPQGLFALCCAFLLLFSLSWSLRSADAHEAFDALLWLPLLVPLLNLIEFRLWAQELRQFETFGQLEAGWWRLRCEQ